MFSSLCLYLEKNINSPNHIVAANEGSSIGIAIGYYLAKKTIPLVYLQNSGLGNVLNPIISLANKQIYKIPMILLIGWRGEIKNNIQIQDEPQHLFQGKITEKVLKLIDINCIKLDSSSNIFEVIRRAKKLAEKKSQPVAILVRKNTFLNKNYSKNILNKKLTREEFLKELCKNIPNNIPRISTTGMLSRELYEISKKRSNFFMCVGGMGHAISLATGVATSTTKNKKVICLDGDGAALMHMGSMSSSSKCNNLIHILFNNNSHDSVGGQKTAAQNLKFINIAKAIGYTNVYSISKVNKISDVLKKCLSNKKSSFIEINCRSGHRNNLIRPEDKLVFRKIEFMNFLKNNG
jgi:phosphonopyruvate decarboxylase